MLACKKIMLVLIEILVVLFSLIIYKKNLPFIDFEIDIKHIKVTIDLSLFYTN